MTTRRPSRLRILMMPGRSATDDNPYIDLLTLSLARHVDVVEFSWYKAFFGQYHILHIHWPEQIIRDPRRLAKFCKTTALIALICLNRVRLRRHVWTMHNRRPHEHSSEYEKWALRLWVRSCVAIIAMNHLDEISTRNAEYIPHGDYVDVVERYAPHNQLLPAKVIVAPGFIRPYKNLESLIRISDLLPGYEVVVSGEARDTEYFARLQRLANEHGAEIRGARLTEDELVNSILEARYVAIPYHNIGNSGIALLALSARRQIIATESESMIELQAEVGPEWVQLVPQTWEPTAVLSALEVLSGNPPKTGPRLDDRDWGVIGDKTFSLYRRIYPGN